MGRSSPAGGSIVGLALIVGCAGATACTELLGDDFEIVTAATSAGGGGQGGSPTCVSGTVSCADDATLLECSEAGEPTETPCPIESPACVDGQCVPCADDALRCNDRDVERCTDGQWSSEQTCEIGCGDAQCLTVVDLGAGAAHTCAVLSNGMVRCWGYHELELLFLDSLDDPAVPGTYSPTPLPIAGIEDAVRIGGGDAHSCALTTEDALKCWGWNGLGQLGTGTIANEPLPVLVALPGAVLDFAVAVGHTCVSLDDGRIACWGLNESGQLGNGDGGSNVFELDPQLLDLGVPASKIRAGDGHTCAIATTTQALCWGAGSSGQLGDGAETTSYTPVGATGDGSSQIALGSSHTCALRQQSLYCWGLNNDGQIGLGAIGPDVVSPTQIATVGVPQRIELGGNHTCLISESGELVCWGRNEEGQIGNGSSGANVNQLTAFVVPIGTVQDVALGQRHTCALTTDGQVLCWGLNNHGQLGAGDTTQHPEPQSVVW